MNVKELAKQVPLIYKMNASFKCAQLKSQMARLHQHYALLRERRGLDYQPQAAVEEFRRRHVEIKPDFRPRAAGSLRVLWVGASQSQDETGFLQALRRAAKTSVFFNTHGNYGLWPGDRISDFERIRRLNDEALLAQVRQMLAANEIDVLLGQMWAHLVSKEALYEIRKSGVPVINVAMDDRLPEHWSVRAGVRMGSVGLGPNVDMVLTTASETCSWYAAEGIPALFWPLASDFEVFAGEESVQKDIDVLFVGNRYGIRGQIVDALEKSGIHVQCYGNGWPNGYVNAEENAALSKRARIILGVATVGHCPDVFTLKLRDFDALMSGALYITQRTAELAMMFVEGKEIEFYSNVEEAARKIHHYLSHPTLREKIARSGQAVAIENHTWDRRLRDTFSTLGLIEPAPTA